MSLSVESIQVSRKIQFAETVPTFTTKTLHDSLILNESDSSLVIDEGSIDEEDSEILETSTHSVRENLKSATFGESLQVEVVQRKRDKKQVSIHERTIQSDVLIDSLAPTEFIENESLDEKAQASVHRKKLNKKHTKIPLLSQKEEIGNSLPIQ